jgi:hypothetical protein
MRVFRDVRGHMAGADFDVELLKCMLHRHVAAAAAWTTHACARCV